MAIYHCSIKIISRGKGKSAVAAAAYRAGEKIKNEYSGITHNYIRKGGVVHTEILLPDHAPTEYADRTILWNAVEQIERNKNAQLAREIELALPVELSREQNISLVREYVKRHFVSAGMCADICIHDKNDGNPHAHVMLTMRPFEIDGSWGAKAHKINGKKICTVDWNEQTKAEEWRARWADAVNTVLEQQGLEERVDHRSFARQGVDKIPTIHMGVAASQMERKGIATERGNINRAIEVTNSQLRQLRARISKLKSWLKDEAKNTAPPTLADVIQCILDRQDSPNRYGQIRNLKTAAKVLDFLTSNNITGMTGLHEKVADMYDRRGDLGGRLNRIDRRIKTLDEHIRQTGYYKEHGELYRQYQQIKRPKKQAAFKEKNYTGIALYESAKRYLDAHLNGHTLPLKSWKDEREKLTAERSNLNREYAVLKAEVNEVEIIRRSAEQIMRTAAREMNPPSQRKPRSREMER